MNPDTIAKLGLEEGAFVTRRKAVANAMGHRSIAAILTALVFPCVSGYSQVYEKLHDFTAALTYGFTQNGSRPEAALVQGGDGNYYGTTFVGGLDGRGTVFRMTPSGSLTTLVEFTGRGGTHKGQTPHALVRGSDGNLYGTTHLGGTLDLGTVFRMTPAGVLTTLVEFTGTGGSNMGRHPEASLVQGSDGNFYGTTNYGGAHNLGTVFRMTPAGVLTTLVEFTGVEGSSRGHWPSALVQGNDGDFYGTTQYGGELNLGTAFRMTPAGGLTTLVEFTGSGGSDKGGRPNAALVEGSDGHFYGTTYEGGALNFGTVFRMTPTGTLTTLVEFTGTGGSNRGRRPYSTLVEGGDGNFYGTTEYGGNSSNLGTVFKITPSGVLTTLLVFSGTGGSNKGYLPRGGLTLGSDGNLLGTTVYGGAFDLGTVFRMTPAGELTTLVEFNGYRDPDKGIAPQALVEGSDGNFYGTTEHGGAFDRGTVFRMTPAGELAALVQFSGATGSNRGGFPKAALVQGSDGNFYGTTWFGGAHNWGTVFRMTPAGVLATLVEFTGTGGSNRGSWPHSAVVEGTDGNFYGTTYGGGALDYGTVFRITPAGTLTTLVEFTGTEGSNRGRFPMAALIEASDGNFYGTTAYGGASDLGTVFRMTPAGALTTLVEFTGTTGSNRGGFPRAALTQGSDGNFYGMTYGGGTLDHGTVFRITPAGTLTTLVEFTGTGGSNKGRWPNAALIEASDGNFYGTTQLGGTHNFGTVFRMTPSAVLTTLYEVPLDADKWPVSGVIEGSDGNLYGTTLQYAGSIYRLVFPGAPLVGVTSKSTSSSSAILESRVNPRGSATSVFLSYGTEESTLAHTLPVSVNLTGYQSRLVGATLENLLPGTTYYYRFQATSSVGEAVTPVHSFVTLAPPLASALPATDILPGSALLHGTVDARHHDATVRFEWGTDGNSFPHSAAASPGLVSGSGPVAVSHAVAGLVKGTTYHYRVVATSAGGTTVSGAQNFRALTGPTATIGGSFALSTTSARVEGWVDPEGSTTSAVFDYGTDGVNFPSSVAAVQGTQTGNGSRPVSAVLTNLAQGTVYHYRLRATSAGGIGLSEPASFSMDVLSGFGRVHPGPPPASGGFLTINLHPSGPLHGWRFLGEDQWRASGIPASGLVPGDRVVEFRPVPGFVHPPNETASVADGTASVLERSYFEAGAAGTGGLGVTLRPESIAEGEGRAQWRLLGEGDDAWRDSGEVLSGLPAGSYLVECKPVEGRATPSNASVPVSAGQTAAPTITYFEAGSPTGLAPSPLAFETVVAEGAGPYPHVGQIVSDTGSGTGFVVKERVVATAAHVVWDEVTLAAASGLRWLHQRHRGDYEPLPQTPRGAYLLTGYDALRGGESPGSFSPQSRNRDIAALYFHPTGESPIADAGRGGHGGFLASDLESNGFLLSGASKMLVGYPVDGVAPASRGRMHATAPFDVVFSPVPFTPAGEGGGERRRLFFTTGIRSSGGASGGPLCVQFEGGAYYPAAIYLGGTAQSIVRAIDSDAVALFNEAEESSFTGAGHTGGGITHTSVTAIGAPGTPGALRVNLAPAGVVNAGAGWRLRPETPWRADGSQRGGLNAGSYILELSTLAGFQPPTPQNVTVSSGQLTTITFTYAPPPAPEAVVHGLGQAIGNGGSSPSALDGTDFGVVEVGGSSSTRTYTIANAGTAPLSVGTPLLSGHHAGDFSVTIPPGASVPPGGSTSFTLAFAPSAPGRRSATISFASNDPARNPFTFAIQGNDEADSDGNGFSDLEEADLASLLASFTVGQTVDLDLSFLRLLPGQSLSVLGLPPGLSFSPATGRIAGRIAGKASAPQLSVRKLDAGGAVASAVALSLAVRHPARAVVAKARPFPATKVGRRSRPQTLRVSNAGELPLAKISVKATGRAARDFALAQPRAKTLAGEASTTFAVTFRPRAKGMRRATATVTSSDLPRSVPLSGRGR